MDTGKLNALWSHLATRQTNGLTIIHGDTVIYERYAEGWNRHKRHGTASLAKALVGGMSLQVARTDGLIQPDDRASQYVPEWSAGAAGLDPRKREITIRHLATHTSGLDDAEMGDMPHDHLPGWQGDFWKWLPVPRDPFTISRDVVPILFSPGTRESYSNPGMAMLAYCVTASLRGRPETDIRSLLQRRIIAPLGIPADEWTCGYNGPVQVNGLPLLGNWGGATSSANATARLGRLMRSGGVWNGCRLLDAAVVQQAITHAGMPNAIGLCWWINRRPDGSGVRWKALPNDAFWGSGAGHKILLVIPSLDLIVVRNGNSLDDAMPYGDAIETHLITPLMQAVVTAMPRAVRREARSPAATPPYPPSPAIARIQFAPPQTIVRQAHDSDCWPLTWGDDDALYAAWGDGRGFDPRLPQKLSLGLARITGMPPKHIGANIPAPTAEQTGSGAKGKKASGLLMVGGILYLLARNAGNAQLAWSDDHGHTWTWANWRFTDAFGYPAFLNFGRNYAGARDEYVYIYSPDTDSAYKPADQMNLARVPRTGLRDRSRYEFFVAIRKNGAPQWSRDIRRRGAVFQHTAHCLRSQITYNAPLKRYLWWQQLPDTGPDPADSRFTGGFGVYDAPEPWGSWTTAFFTAKWDVGPGETGSLPTKWMSADGKTCFLTFSGEDSFSVRKAVIELRR